MERKNKRERIFQTIISLSSPPPLKWQPNYFVCYLIPSCAGKTFWFLFLNKTCCFLLVLSDATQPFSHKTTFVLVSMNVMCVYAVCINLLWISSYLIECFVIKILLFNRSWLFRYWRRLSLSLFTLFWILTLPWGTQHFWHFN